MLLSFNPEVSNRVEVLFPHSVDACFDRKSMNDMLMQHSYASLLQLGRTSLVATRLGICLFVSKPLPSADLREILAWSRYGYHLED